MSRYFSFVRVAALGASVVLAPACATTPAPRSASTVRQITDTLYEPSLVRGPLFFDVQTRGIFPDSKTFVDARPLAAPDEIAARYAAEKDRPGFDLKAFVERNFDVPKPFAGDFRSDTSQSMEDHIRALWPALTRQPDTSDARSSLVRLPNPYVVPGGRFREVYYWDSYFTMQGLVASGRTDLVRSMLDNFAYLIRTVGHIPNGNRTYYLSRSQPPYFAAMVGLYARATDSSQAVKYLDALEAEHAFWMDGADRLKPGQLYRRAVMMPDGTVLNRYWDDRSDPRPESYKPDYELAMTLPADKREAFLRNARATAESGWDFSTRWMRDPKDLRTLETTSLIPVDLNALLWNNEVTIAALRRLRGQPGDADVAARYERTAAARRKALLQLSFDMARGFFYDVRWLNWERVTDRPSLAAAAPLYFGMATRDQGLLVAENLKRQFLKPGGFVTTLIPSGQQWDAPNGWAPLEWMAIEGVRRYGRTDIADTARARWLALNRRVYKQTGKMTEKYDVEDLSKGAGGGEYPNQDGFGWTNGVALALSAQMRGLPAEETRPPGEAAAWHTGPALPVLAFPEPGVDDTAAYRSYQTRLYRDAAGNTVQVYLEGSAGRVVNVWADAENESLGFTARDASGKPAPVRWDGPGAEMSGNAARRTVEYRLAADAPRVDLGLFVLGSMRVERDVQYAKWHEKPFSAGPFPRPELERMFAALDRLPAAERAKHLALLGAPDVATLRARTRPTITTAGGDTSWTARVIQPALDGRDTLVLEVRADPRLTTASVAGDVVSLRARSGSRLPFTVRITTSGRALTPLSRADIFNADYFAFLDSVRLATSAPNATEAMRQRLRFLERQTRGVELLSSREKLMAGLPTYATYFGRDMLMTALMMRPIWREEMSEAAIGAALRKLSPTGQVSHEEALGGQAVREAAAEYATDVAAALAAPRGARRDSLLARARDVLANLRRVRENYHMIDDELQLAVLEARWLESAAVPAERKRAFLLDATDGSPRVERMLAELALVSRMTQAYAERPVATNLVSFEPRAPERGAAPGTTPRWSSASWRDSGDGYAGGRFAMDVNAIWAPRALDGMGRVLAALKTLGIPADSIVRAHPAMAASPLARYTRDPDALRKATETWWGAWRHFDVRLAPAEIRTRVSARLATMPAAERAYWNGLLPAASRDSLELLALSLDGEGRPIAVANTDPATRLFLGEDAAASFRAGETPEARTLRDVRLFVRDYPVGLFVERVGPLVANDAYATPPVWRAFDRDPYHGPRVVWGREVNLFLLGAAERIATAKDAGYARELRDAITRVRTAAQASGFHSELWSYDFVNGKPSPVRYGTSGDVQLWSTTELAVEFALSRLPK